MHEGGRREVQIRAVPSNNQFDFSSVSREFCVGGVNRNKVHIPSGGRFPGRLQSRSGISFRGRRTRMVLGSPGRRVKTPRASKRTIMA